MSWYNKQEYVKQSDIVRPYKKLASEDERKRAKIVRKRGVYCYTDTLTGLIRYIGSTTCTLSNVDRNHRNWRSLGYSSTYFRDIFVDNPAYGRNLQISWLEQPEDRNQYQVEVLEGICIRTHKTCNKDFGGFNKDLDPVGSSIEYERYTLPSPSNDLLFAA